MRVVGRLLAVLLTAVIGLGVPGLARAQVTGATGTNTQAGDNRATTNQRGANESGDAVGGQVNGVVAEGRTSVDARNTSSNSSVDSGEAVGENTSKSFTGLNATGDGAPTNFQDGDNRTTVTQTADATSGDAVSGQIIGAVTGPEGSASIVAANTSDDNDVETGVASFINASDSFVGLNATATADGPGPVFATPTNVQEGDNRLTVDQVASSATGNGVAGQVIGVVANGATSVDATNTSTTNDVDTVATASDNISSAFVGLDANPIALGPTAAAVASNLQEGDNRARISQFAPGTANSSSAFVGLDAEPVAAGPTATAVADNDQEGDNSFLLDQTAPVSTASVDSVAGQVVGAVTDVGGSASLVAANTSDNNTVQNVGVAGQVLGVVSAGATSVDASNTSSNNDVDGGVTSGSNDSLAFVGLNAEPGAFGASDAPATATAINEQVGDNRLSGFQSASTGSGYPIAGQIIGVVTSAGGSSSVVASNTSDDNDVETGEATAPNSSLAFVGLDASAFAADAVPVTATATNTQEGDNRARFSETASATSGVAVAGEILGVVSAGATSVDARNRSIGSDAESGDAFSANESEVFAGLDAAASDSEGANRQEGDNRKTSVLTAEATSGDAIAGQVGGVVTAAGGSASVVLDNTSDGIDAATGESEFLNFDVSFVGLRFTTGPIAVG